MVSNIEFQIISWHSGDETLDPKKEDEDDMLDLAFGLTKTSRLSCQIIMQDKFDGLTVKIPKER